MELTPELIGNAIVGTIVIAAIVGNYLRTLRQPAKTDPVLTGVAGGFVERDQMERLIEQVKRIGDIMEDKNATAINDQLKDMAASIADLKQPRRRQS